MVKRNERLLFLSLQLYDYFLYFSKKNTMIQRIQTIYLTVAIVALVLTLFFPFALYTIEGTEFVYDSLGFEKSNELSLFLPAIAPLILSIVLSIVALVSFKNRKRQLLLNKINFVAVLLTIVCIFLNFNKIESTFSLLPENINYGMSFLFPIISFVAVLMASRSINQDEKLIKSMDRIR